jgi:hypothetical protein
VDHRRTSLSSAGGKTLVTSTDRRRAERPKAKRSRRLPFVALAIGVVVVLVAALTGATAPMQVTRFALAGHWGFNSVLHTIFHIDGGTATVDAQASMPGDPGSLVVQGDTSGYVVGDSRITQFGKSDLSVQGTNTPPAKELPVAIETVGGPYLVYRGAGKIVRLGQQAAAMDAGGPVGDPIATEDGTLWLHRTQSGLICELPKGAPGITTCPVIVTDNHPGALTVVDNHPEFLDLATDQLHSFDAKGLGPGVAVGVPVSLAARPAGADVSGRVAILDPPAHHLILADPKGQKAVTVPLPDGDYEGPVSTGTSVALVDRKSDTLLTFGSDGKQEASKPVPHQDNGEPRLSQGQDNHVYVEDSAGTHVLVVDGDGKVQDVPTAAKPSSETTAAAPVSSAGGQTGPSQGQPTGNQPTHQPPPPPVTTVNKPPVPASPPGAPPGVAATAADSSAVVTWGTAADNRATITAYHVTWPGGSLDVGGGVRRANVNGLANGTSYVFTVTATNSEGTGPGASSAPVTPFAAAAAPVVQATTGGSVSWNTPNLRGGTLVDYVVSATGLADQTVTATSATYNLAAGQTYTFTVHAVTRFGGGANIDGANGSATVTVPAKSVQISEGAKTTSGNCKAPDCARVNVTVTGLKAKISYPVQLSSGSTTNVQTENLTTDASGNAEYDNLDYDVPGQTIWVTVDGMQSNTLVWK